jgi:hypothetical protein
MGCSSFWRNPNSYLFDTYGLYQILTPCLRVHATLLRSGVQVHDDVDNGDENFGRDEYNHYSIISIYSYQLVDSGKLVEKKLLLTNPLQLLPMSMTQMLLKCR